MNKRRRLGAAAWRELAARFAAGGLSVQMFCQREKISPQSLYRWRSKLAEPADRTVARAAVPVTNVAGGFLDLGSVTPASHVRVELRLDLGGGVILQIARN